MVGGRHISTIEHRVVGVEGESRNRIIPILICCRGEHPGVETIAVNGNGINSCLIRISTVHSPVVVSSSNIGEVDDRLSPRYSPTRQAVWRIIAEPEVSSDTNNCVKAGEAVAGRNRHVGISCHVQVEEMHSAWGQEINAHIPTSKRLRKAA